MTKNYKSVQQLLVWFNIDEPYYEEQVLENWWTRDELIQDLYDTYKEQGLTLEEAELIADERLE